MKPTHSKSGLLAWLLAGLLALQSASAALAAESPMQRPAALERDVQFWIRVYTEVNTNAGFVHDENNLAVIYETLHFAPNASPREREREVDATRDRYVAALKRVATASGPLSQEDQKVRALWGDEGTPIRLLEATNHIRFQLGQSDRFREGLVRAGQWETHIAETLANLGLPPELAVLPHVESSFNPAAYSKVGAAGLWQFMRSTGRRYMRIDATVDDRLDPFRSTQAAAQFLSYNYRLLGTWPLALTAYNHGPAGIRRAMETLGTDDIVKILRNYKSPSFGFASRNFYVSFLAALEVDHNPEKYFGSIQRTAEARFQELVTPGRISVAALERALGFDRDTLRSLNPALLPAFWRGQRPVPSGYRLRLPLSTVKWTPELLARRLGGGALLVAATQPQPATHRVLPGETLATIAEQYRVGVRELASLNRLRTSARVRVGRSLRVPEQQPTLVAALDRSGAAAASAPQAPSATPVAAGGGIPAAATSPGISDATSSSTSSSTASSTASSPTNADTAAVAVAAAPAATSGETATPAAIAATSSPAGAAPAPDASAATQPDAVAATHAPAAPPGSAPAAAPSAPVAAAASHAAVKETPGVYVVQRGESLSEIAAHVGMSESKLLDLNKIRNPDYIFEGQRLRLASADVEASAPQSANGKTPELPAPASSTPAPPAAGGVPAAVAERESEEDAAAVASVAKPESKAEPVSAAQAEALSPALGAAAGEAPETADPIDYSVAKDGSIAVAAAETLGHYADWLGVGASRLRDLNRMRYGRPVLMGHRIKLDFTRVSREGFEAKRREYHRTLEAGYFAAHRIVGTEVYIARRGDSLWTVTQRYEHLPVWLLQQYNPDVDFSEMRAGTQIVVPKVEDVAAAGG